MFIDRFHPAINRWALSFPSIRRVWLYGSRVKGNARPDSDLDVAVEIDPQAFRGQPPFAWWIFESTAMKTALAPLISVAPDVQQYLPSNLAVFSAVAEHGILVYEKATRAAG